MGSPTPPAHSIPDLDALLVSREIMENPYPIYRRLREEAPIFWSETWKAWVISSYDSIVASLKDKENLSNENRQASIFANLNETERMALSQLRHYFAQKDVIGSDPPDHTRMRALVQKAFTARTVAAMEVKIRRLAVDMISEAGAMDSFDFIEEVAHPLPVMLIAEILGAPVEDRPLFKRWSAEILAFMGTGQTQVDTALRSQASLMEMFDYMNDMIDRRKQKPEDDVITTLAFAEEEGKGFTRDELLATCNTLLTAGHETTTSLIGNLVHHLLSHEEQWNRVKESPQLIPSAIEESLRFDAPKQRDFRKVKKTHVFAGFDFQEDQLVFQLLGSGNRDPLKFVDADRYDITRTPNDHLSFGSGIHFCLGAPLARLEARVVLEELIRQQPDAGLSAQSIVWQERALFRGPLKLGINSNRR
jgi:cytochrome P450